MDAITERIAYSDFVDPIRPALRWSALAFTTLPAPALARETKHVTVSADTVTVDGEPHALQRCRWFRGFACHDPKLSAYRAYAPAIVIAWPPFGNDDRTICGMDPKTAVDVAALLDWEGIPEDRPRSRHEGLQLNAITLAGAALVACLLAALRATIVSPAIPLASIAISALVGAIAARIWHRHQVGDFQFQENPSRTLGPGFALIAVGTYAIIGGRPWFQNVVLYVWVLPLAIVQSVCLYGLYMYVRGREDVRLVMQQQTSKHSPPSIAPEQIAALYKTNARLRSAMIRWGLISIVSMCAFCTAPFLVRANIISESTEFYIVWSTCFVIAVIAGDLSKRVGIKLKAQQCPGCGKPLLWKARALICQSCDEVFVNPRVPAAR